MTLPEIIAALRAVQRGESVDERDADFLTRKYILNEDASEDESRPTYEVGETGELLLTLADERDAAVRALEMDRLRTALAEARLRQTRALEAMRMVEEVESWTLGEAEYEKYELEVIAAADEIAASKEAVTLAEAALRAAEAGTEGGER